MITMPWLFSSSNFENIKVGYERLLWGFWDREAGKKQRRNWRSFNASYNRIKPFDFAILQTTHGDVHAVGIIKETFYDDQTPIWPQELEQDRVLFPWRVSFSFIILSLEKICRHFIKIENYIDGYGLGYTPSSDLILIIDKIAKRSGFQVKGLW